MQTPRTAKAAPANDSADTRSRILSAAQWLFRKRGYHATGVNDILAAANAPKGSLYHHFPGGKEEIGVAVIQAITEGLLGLFAASRARSTEALLLQAGERLVAIAEQTQFELCTVLSGFTAERRTSPLLGDAVSAAYASMAAMLVTHLKRDGFSARLASERAQVIVALVEGGSLLSQAHQDAAPFRLAIKQAATLCRLD
jgi:TetR/AcrR family transcriptional regulator, lmrAB and yxaGH operons repressor